jgi:hypothetical protein
MERSTSKIMAKRKKKHQKERVLEPLVKPGEPIRKVPVKVPAGCPGGSNRREV